MRRARNVWYSSNGVSNAKGFSPRALGPECVCVADIMMFAAGMPVASVICRFASSNTSRFTDTLSTTANASFVVPSSNTRQRACNSSLICLAGGMVKFPTMPAPRNGVMLLIAAPALNTLTLVVGCAFTCTAMSKSAAKINRPQWRAMVLNFISHFEFSCYPLHLPVLQWLDYCHHHMLARFQRGQGTLVIHIRQFLRIALLHFFGDHFLTIQK